MIKKLFVGPISGGLANRDTMGLRKTENSNEDLRRSKFTPLLSKAHQYDDLKVIGNDWQKPHYIVGQKDTEIFT